MAGFGQYLKDTRSELNHVAWPTQAQTIVYTVMVVAVSVAVALYLGLFDYIFTGAVKRVVENTPSQSAPAVDVSPVPAAAATNTAPVGPLIK